MENDETQVDVLETTSEEAEETTQETQEEEKGVEYWKAEALKNKAILDRNKQKAEAPKTKPKESRKEGELTTADILFLAKTDIHDDDMDELRDFAKFKGIGVKEAYAQYKGILDVRTQERRTAVATQTKGGARGSSKVDGQELHERAMAGLDIPDDEASLQALFTARRAAKFKK